MRYVIVGNGIAGVNAAEAVRSLDAEGPITMIGDETFPPYCRPMISMVLEGGVKPEELPIRSSRFYEELNIAPVLGERVSALDPDAQTLQVGGRTVGYDRLLIATGADPRPIKASGLDLPGIFFMRTEAHVRRMLDMLPESRKALVLGGGLVGFKAACGLMRRGLKVTMLIRSGYPLSMQVDPAAGSLLLEALRTHGLEVRVGLEAKAFEGRGRVARAQLSDGSSIDCDLVVVGKGVLPALSFVPRDRLEVDLGLVVDDFLQTSCAGIYAAGDVAESVDVARQTRWVNAIWPEAAMQGRVAGLNLAGRRVPYRRSLGRNVIRIFDLDVMTAGLVNPAENDAEVDILSRMDLRRRSYRKLVFRGELLVGAVLVKDIDQGGVLTALIQNRLPVAGPRERLLEPTFNFRKVA
jgi:nitrite reductase (NADH) large subunit